MTRRSLLRTEWMIEWRTHCFEKWFERLLVIELCLAMFFTSYILSKHEIPLRWWDWVLLTPVLSGIVCIPSYLCVLAVGLAHLKRLR